MSRAPPGDAEAAPGRHTGLRNASHSSGVHRSLGQWVGKDKGLAQTAQGGGRGLLQGVKEAGGSVLPTEKGEIEQV